MKQHLTLKNLFVVAVTIYGVISIERHFATQTPVSSEKVRYMEEKQQMQEENSRLQNKIHSYEIKQLKKRASVDTLSNSELDSEWASIHGQR